VKIVLDAGDAALFRNAAMKRARSHGSRRTDVAAPHEHCRLLAAIGEAHPDVNAGRMMSFGDA